MFKAISKFKIVLVSILILIPFLLFTISISEGSQIRSFDNQISCDKSILSAGSYQDLTVNLDYDVEKITIVVYKGDKIPAIKDRTEKNFYQWTYNNNRCFL